MMAEEDEDEDEEGFQLLTPMNKWQRNSLIAADQNLRHNSALDSPDRNRE